MKTYNFYSLIMFTQKKQQGFIIRKNINLPSQLTQRKKFMSQTDFYRKRQSQQSSRSPGSILRFRFKEDVGIIKSTNWNFDHHNENPEHLGKYGRDRGDQFDENSFDEFQINSKSIIFGVDIQGNVQLYHILKRVTGSLHNRVSSFDVLPTLKQYFQFIAKHEVLDMNTLAVPTFRKKLLKDSLLYERVSLLVIGFVEAFDIFSISRSYVINLANYVLDNFLLRMGILTKGQNKSINEILEAEKKEDFVKKGYDKVKNNNEVILQTIYKLAKNDNLFYENMKKMMKLTKGIQLKQHFKSILQYFAFFLCASQKDKKIPFLALAPAPFLPQQESSKYTLVINVLDICCNKNKKSANFFRPYAEYFLNEMSKYYEIVSLTDAMPNQVNKLISLVDKKEHIKHRLYKFHHDKSKSVSGKDFTLLGRKLDHVVALDTVESEQYNTIVINSWKGKKNDAQLAEICPILAMIAVKKLKAQKAVRKIKQKVEENQKLGLKYLNCGFDLQ